MNNYHNTLFPFDIIFQFFFLQKLREDAKNFKTIKKIFLTIASYFFIFLAKKIIFKIPKWILIKSDLF
jgi:hypothetical protein